MMRRVTWIVVAVVLVLAAGAGAAWGPAFRAGFEANRACCQIPGPRNAWVTLQEALGVAEFPSEIGQDKWVLETIFPGVTDGYFVDVGSGDGTYGSNSKALEARGWQGVCVDPFPTRMRDRTCQMFKDVVFRETGQKVQFRTAGGLGGVDDTLGAWNERAAKAPAVEFTTVSMNDLLERAKAPSFIHFISMDIEGAELEALRGFPFDRVRVGAWAIEHNREEPKRSDIKALLEQHGYQRVHTYKQDDFYAAAR